ncbi:V-type ATP synthase subunit I [Clostridium polyendosporum]|uniref:V-type ATP synthase subunit I n=1 Tax=Clostridium polyendosporum TaxID=69208 RepID=A0A919RW91_9CLOT|nr:V-type ATPase 116kDa subunit family protein [Clostridium polyendosporum]GIM27457.1 V-type ATP synthase subunit I [Clostridium polyendosporum]
MAIEKMYLINIVGPMKNFDGTSRRLAVNSCFHPINAVQEINSSNFLLKTSQENMEALVDICYIRPFIKKESYEQSEKKCKELIKELKVIEDKKVNVRKINYDIQEADHRLEEVYKGYDNLHMTLLKKKEELDESRQLLDTMSFLKEIRAEVKDFVNLSNFTVGLYKTKKSSMKKLEENYENIPSIIKEVYSEKEFSIFLSFTPNLLYSEVEKIFIAANCESITLSSSFNGTPEEVCVYLKGKIEVINSKINDINIEIRKYLLLNNDLIYDLENIFIIESKAEDIKRNAACTNEFYFISGWVPEGFIEGVNDSVDPYKSQTIIIAKKPEQIVNNLLIPPTKLKNNWFFRPFEALVKMYGIPTYGEIDPTPFLAITYTLMFGAMFGDIGQGAIIFAFGILLKYVKNQPSLGGILSRLGVSSIIFGFLFGSIFGFEDIIPAVLVRPMENIPLILLWAVVFGCVFLMQGFILGIINRLRKRDIECGVFGKEGIAGFLFYISALLIVIDKLLNLDFLQLPQLIVILLVMLVLILLREPLANLIIGKRPLFRDGAKDYFIEGIFEIFEVVLSMFSNTLSFIRVGAFALNHVGLFIAFSALASMMRNFVGSIIILVIGNVIIIGLEGLIVFIQGLRLQYYELFSKYYDGEGIPFQPVSTNILNKSESR